MGEYNYGLCTQYRYLLRKTKTWLACPELNHQKISLVRHGVMKPEPSTYSLVIFLFVKLLV